MQHQAVSCHAMFWHLVRSHASPGTASKPAQSRPGRVVQPSDVERQEVALQVHQAPLSRSSSLEHALCTFL
eukprot:363371-Chlamydomonas_euryale.AAC.10